jgi:hypothetical protein
LKIISIILSLYVILLAFMPCEDELGSAFSQDQSNLATSQQDATHHDIVQHEKHLHGDASEDLCTPFCQCHCCHTHITFFDTGWYLENLPFTNQKSIPYVEQAALSLPFSMCQPPRV